MPVAGGISHTLYCVGPVHTTFRTPQPHSPLYPHMSLQLLALLELVAMEGEAPPSPTPALHFETSSQGTCSDDSAPDSPSKASTVSRSTDESRRFTP